MTSSNSKGVGPLQDSGNRTTFETGAQRDRPGGKGRYDLISPIALRRLAQHYENGAIKYADRNWEKGIPLCDFLDAAQRHLGQILEGDTTEDHAAAVAWNIFGFIHTKEMIDRGLRPQSLNNLPEPMVSSIHKSETRTLSHGIQQKHCVKCQGTVVYINGGRVYNNPGDSCTCTIPNDQEPF